MVGIELRDAAELVLSFLFNLPEKKIFNVISFK